MSDAFFGYLIARVAGYSAYSWWKNQAELRERALKLQNCKDFGGYSVSECKQAIRVLDVTRKWMRERPAFSTAVIHMPDEPFMQHLNMACAVLHKLGIEILTPASVPVMLDVFHAHVCSRCGTSLWCSTLLPTANCSFSFSEVVCTKCG